ncbi:hypothetical protein ELK54_08735 [Klebsiella pneumoniae]|nr:hypothetical protein [Klebsiella pneumoniae]MBL2648547.1 hypothetical protein [Klebsiella pneumoniae]
MGGPNAICKQDKAFMPPSGTTAGTVSDVYRPAALRLHGPALFEPAGARRPDKAKPSGKRREERHYSAAVFPLPGSLNASP